MLTETPGAAGAAETVVTTCPACGYHVAVLFYDGGEQPLATLGWPRSEAEARAMPRYRLRFVSCVDCGHVFNAAFDYACVPYPDQPNRMYNHGAHWSRFLAQVRAEMLERLPARPVVVEIGHGDGAFLERLAAARPAGRYIGFDPNGAAANRHPAVALHRALFVPERHLAELRPDLILSRHVLEHLGDPLGFLQNLAYAATRAGWRPLVYLEVPCIDRAVAHGRLEDFYYEHNSHFTTESFSRMLARGFAAIDALNHGYNGEVVYAFLRLKGRLEHLERTRLAHAFAAAASATRDTVALQLAALLAAGKRVAVWGGTGKSAAFLHAHRMDAARFPLVVDSDPAKVDTYVPGTGQRIRFRDVLREEPADVIIVPPQWRAGDIVAEMRAHGITGDVLIEHGGRLVDYFSGGHPYFTDTESLKDTDPFKGTDPNGIPSITTRV